MHNVTTSVGGLDNAVSAGALPRGKLQANYIRCKNKEKMSDPIYSITQTMKSYAENDDERFIRSYTYDDGSPKVVAFTDRQLDDLINFCCNDSDSFKSLLYADITFKLGPFFLLVTVYLNTMLLSRRTQSCPVMIGPMMICMLKDKLIYVTLFQKLVSNVLAYLLTHLLTTS